jgi:hypothetical protein
MSKVSIATLAEAPLVAPPPGVTGQIESRALFDTAEDPIHAHVHTLARDAVAQIGPSDTDCVGYVWKGAVEAGGRRLAAGSSLVVERGAVVQIRGDEQSSQVLIFHGARPSDEPRAGGHVHLLPTERVRRAQGLGAPGVVGALHANAACPTCKVWMHENHLPPREPAPEDAAKGVHAHSENEVIFVVEGELRFGTRALAPGSAIAIAADAFYTIGPGPTGLKIVNFRAGLPTEIRFKGGEAIDEVGLWREIAAPDYLEPLAS